MSKKCVVCGGEELNLSDHWQWAISGELFGLASCKACGSAFTSPLPDNKMLSDFYNSAFNYQWYRDHHAVKIRDCRQRIAEYRPLMGSRVLDFGGGVGYFSEVARAEGYQSVTYDPYTTGGALEAESWDTVVSLHMLEHANDPDQVIATMNKVLVTGGNLIIAVPNFESRGYRELGMGWVWAQPPLMHVFHFTAQGLKCLLSRHGFTDFKVTYHERWDANLFTDIQNVEKFRCYDAAWARKYFCRFSVYRKWVAWRNGTLRFEGLKQAMLDYDPENRDYAELQIVATKRLVTR